jgi:hypothetical protein
MRGVRIQRVEIQRMDSSYRQNDGNENETLENTSSRLQHYVQTAVPRDVWHIAMNANSIRGSATQQGEISYLYIHQISPIQYIIRIIGGVINSML